MPLSCFQLINLALSDNFKSSPELPYHRQARSGGQPSPVAINGLYDGTEAVKRHWQRQEVPCPYVDLLSFRVAVFENHVRPGTEQR